MHLPELLRLPPQFFAALLPTVDCELSMLTYGLAGSPLLIRAYEQIDVESDASAENASQGESFEHRKH